MSLPGLGKQKELEDRQQQVYQDICISVQELCDVVYNARVAIANLRARKQGLPLQGVAKALVDFHDSNKDPQLNFGMIPPGNKDLWQKSFDDSVAKAEKIYAFLWPNEASIETELEQLGEVEEARQLARKIIEVDLKEWEKEQRGVTPPKDGGWETKND